MMSVTQSRDRLVTKGTLRRSVPGEKHLLHGTSPEHLLDILDQGFNDKLASLKGMSLGET